MDEVTSSNDELILQKLTDVENLVVGIVTGIFEQIFVQPILYFKAAAQLKSKGLPFTLNPRVIYRGTVASCSNMAVLTGIQFQFSGVAQKFLTGGEERELSPLEEISAGAAGGLVSAPACSLLELTMIQQQRYAGTIWATPMRIYQDYGVRNGLFRGLVCSALRESIYTAGLLGMVPVCKKNFREHFGLNNTVSSMLGSIFAGLFCAALSHPADTIKTRMQGGLGEAGSHSVIESFNSVYKEFGYSAFFRGYSWRSLNIIIDFMILNALMEQFAPLLFPERFSGRDV